MEIQLFSGNRDPLSKVVIPIFPPNDETHVVVSTEMQSNHFRKDLSGLFIYKSLDSPSCLQTALQSTSKVISESGAPQDRTRYRTRFGQKRCCKLWCARDEIAGLSKNHH